MCLPSSKSANRFSHAWFIHALLLLLVMLFNPAFAETKEYGVTVTKPNRLFVVDMQSLTVSKECTFPGLFNMGVLVMSPDDQIAYFLANGTNTVFGVNIDTCELVFRADQTVGDLRVRSMGSLAVSKDGKVLYTVQQRTHLLIDRYDVQEPHLAVFNTGDGLEATAIRSFPVPRQISGIAEAGSEGLVYMMGPDIYTIDPNTGEVETVALSRSWQRPLFTPAIGLNLMANGRLSNELSRGYTVMQFTDEKKDPATARTWWGITRVNLTSGVVESKEIGPLQSIMFSLISHPNNPDLVYGVSNYLQEYNVKKQELARIKELPHNFYAIGLSRDGSKIYLSGALNVIAVYDREDLEMLGKLELPGDMVYSAIQIVTR